MLSVVILTALLICRAHSQICGGPIYPGPRGLDPYGPYCDPYGPGLIPNIAQPCTQPCGPVSCNPPILPSSFIPNPAPCSLINQPILPCPQQVITEIPAVISSGPCNANPVVATTVLDNTLANSLANAIQLLIVSNLIENTLGSNTAALTQCLGIPNGYTNNFEVVTPDYYPGLISCDTPCYDTFPSFEVPCYQEPVIYQSCIDPCNGYGSYSGIEVPFGFDNCGPCRPNIVGIDTCGNSFGVPYGCSELAITPVAVEVPFPTSIPAQLLCNFGLMPTTVPYVNVNVEPLPFDGCGCSNLFGNNFFY